MSERMNELVEAEPREDDRRYDLHLAPFPLR